MALEAGHPPLPLFMTEDEFEAWCDEDTRAEFVDGKVVRMPAVALIHYGAGKFLLTLLELFLQDQPLGEVVGPEVVVRLRPGLRRVPDLMFVAAGSTAVIREKYVDGAPDVVWEIISEDSELRDTRDKYREYEAAGVREYWLLDPDAKTLSVFTLQSDGAYVLRPGDGGRFASAVISGFWIREDWLWQRPMPRLLSCLREILEELPRKESDES